MKHQTKKVIAREFIVLILTLVITLLAFLGTAVYNAFLNSKITPLRESFNENVKQADSLARSYNSKLQNQQWFYNTLDIYFNLPKSRYKSYDIVWKRFQEISSSDSIEYAYRVKWKQDTRESFAKMGFDTPEKLKAFIERNRMIYQDYKDLQKANEIYSKNNLINSQIASYESSHYTNERQMEFSLAAFLIAFSLLFLFRYIHYGIKWSVRTLKE